MKIDKITFKNEQAWVVIRSEEDEYLGTWHIVHRPFVKALREEMPEKIKFEKKKVKKK